jgi:arabinose-5-phosphate isomerase
VIVVHKDGAFAGLWTDGDLRRSLLAQRAGTPDLLRRSIDEVMTARPASVKPASLVGEALRLLRERKIDQLPVIDDAGKPVGLLDVQDLLEIHAFS